MPNSCNAARLLLALFLVAAFALSALAQTGEIRGFVYNQKTGEPVIYTPVFLKGTGFGVITDVNGYYSLTKIPAGTYSLTSTSLGYDTASEYVEVVADKVQTRKLYIQESVKEVGEVEIEGRRSTYRRENTVNASLTQITPREIKILPSVGGEPDILQYIQTVPGVVSTGDQGGQVFIRGGTLAQNLTLLDGMVLYNPFHSIGLYSVFDNDLLKSADFYTAGFNAEYGGRASSVIDVKTIDGNKNRNQVNVSLGPIASKVNANGPLYKNDKISLTYLVSGRTSYLDQSGDIFYKYAQKSSSNLNFSFLDLYGKVTLGTENGSKLSVFGFNFSDKADLGFPNSFDWKNTGAGASFLLLAGNSSVLTGNFSVSNYEINISQEEVSGRNSGVDAFNGGIDLTYYINKSELKYGLGVIGNNTFYNSRTLTGANYGLTKNNLEFFGYAKYRINTNRLILDPGFRAHYYASIGYLSWEPRMGAKFVVTPEIRLKAAAGMYSQNLISTRSDRDIVNLFNGYVSSPDQVYRDNNAEDQEKNPIQLSRHLVVGVEFEPIKNVEIDIEPYLKYFPVFININSLRTSQRSPEFISESSLAKGIDVTVRYDRQPYYVQLTYSLARVTRQFEAITYAPVFDRRHNVNLLVSWFPIKNQRDFELDVRFNLGSGLPFTQTQALYEDIPFYGGLEQDYVNTNGDLGIYFGTLNDFNKGRLPYYHRLDVGVKKQFKIGKNGRLELSAGVTNAYNRKNVFYIDRINLGNRVNQLPILPYLTANLSF